MPRVSVVIPTYNRARLICETLDSVLAQTYRDFEIIVVDDGSTDGTQEVVSRYGPSLRYLRQENAGPAAARNAGIRASGGEYVAFLDSDDLWLPRKLEEEMAVLASEPSCAWAYCDVEMFDGQNGRVIGRYGKLVHRPRQGWVPRWLLLGDFVASPTPVVRRTVFEQVGYFDESDVLRHREDWDMWLRIAARYPVRYLPQVLARYRRHSGSSRQGESPLKVHKSHVAIIERAVAFAPDVYGPVRSRALAVQCVRAGRSLAGQGDMPDARMMFAQAVGHWPWAVRAYGFWLASVPGHRLWASLAAVNRWRKRRFLVKGPS